MKLVSVNVGGPKEFSWMGKTILTSIFKYPVADTRKVSFLNIDGDKQSDLSVHGGRDKAVYAYDLSHYEYWKTVLDREDWQYGLFGENLTTEGLLDEEVLIGNLYKIGTAKLQVIQPRFPCFKLNVRFGSPDMIERFVKEKRHGIYFRVIEEGFIKPGDEIILVEPSPCRATISDYVNCYYSKGENKSILKELLHFPHLPQRHRMVFEGYL